MTDDNFDGEDDTSSSSVGGTSAFSASSASTRLPLHPIYETDVEQLPQVSFEWKDGNSSSSSITGGEIISAGASVGDSSSTASAGASHSSIVVEPWSQPQQSLPKSRIIAPIPEESTTIISSNSSDDAETNTSSIISRSRKNQRSKSKKVQGRSFFLTLLAVAFFVIEYTHNVGQVSPELDQELEPQTPKRNLFHLFPIQESKTGKKKINGNDDTNNKNVLVGETDGTQSNSELLDYQIALQQRLRAARHHEPNGEEIVIPEAYNNLADVVASSSSKADVLPFFWHIFRSAASTSKTLFSQCWGLTLAAEVGGKTSSAPFVRLIKANGGAGTYVDVDASTVEGLQHAANIGLVTRPMQAHAVVSPLLYETADILFPPQDMYGRPTSQDDRSLPRGALFALLRDPIDRVLSSFYFHRSVQSYGPTSNTLEIHDWATSDQCESNYLVRSIVRKQTYGGGMTRDDLRVAKEVLRRKMLIGLLDEREPSFRRFKKYFGWETQHPASPSKDVVECEERLLNYAWVNHNKHPYLESSPTYRTLIDKNLLDLELYEYAKMLFEEQGQLLGLEQ